MQQKPQKKVPVRRCVGCNAQKPKKELVRIVRSPEGEVGVDLTGKKSGRGAYLCACASCLAKARKAKRLERAFGVPVPDDVYERLTEEILCAEQAAKEAMPRGE
ncbi:MAG: YlxR family protein [Oscillospiraceae bacterium]|nr:YlxR family protein [Oscillospiraceae bacterium]